MTKSRLSNDGFPEEMGNSKPAAYGNQPLAFTLNIPIVPIPKAPVAPVLDFSREGHSVGISTDLDASYRLIEAMKGDYRHVPALGWAYWDGARWSFNRNSKDVEGNIAKTLAKKCARDWLQQTILRYGGEKGGATMISKAESHEGSGHISSAVSLAKCNPQIDLDPGALDSNPWLLNVKNGVLDLKTGLLLPHEKSLFQSKMAGVRFDPSAKSEVLDRFLEDLEIQVPGVCDFLARCFGMSMTGDVEAESFFLISGDGGSGKTTLTEAFADMLGDYSYKPPFEMFCALGKNTRDGAAPSPDLYNLLGARFVFATEGDSRARLNEGRIKQLSGGEKVTARALQQTKMDVLNPTWKIWLVSNFDPRTESEDPGVWRRMVKVHFKAVPEKKRDHLVKRTLLTDPTARSAILNWCLKGCLDWQARGGGRKGLAIPEALIRITEEYRESQDHLLDWWESLEERYDLDEANLTAKTADRSQYRATPDGLRRDYIDWCKGMSVVPKRSTDFTLYLAKRGLVKAKRRVYREDGTITRPWQYFGIKPRGSSFVKTDDKE